jgi:hypothetical protein
MRPRRNILPWIVLLALTVGASAQESTKRSNIPAPAKTIRKYANPCNLHPDVAFLYDHNTYDLQSGCFYRLLFDTPKAVLFRHCACYLSEDVYYFYYRDPKFEYDLAFGKEPTSQFAGHAIWTRRFDSTNWQLQTADAIMASPR